MPTIPQSLIAGVTLVLVLALALASASAETSYPSPDVPKRIPASGTAGAMDASLIVVTEGDGACGQGRPVTHARVRIDLTHEFNADLMVFVTSPRGTWVRLWNALGGTSMGMLVTIDDDAATKLDGQVLDATSRRPNEHPGQSLSEWRGESALGEWKLDVVDGLGGDTGMLNTWELVLTCGEDERASDVADPSAEDGPPAENEPSAEDEPSDEDQP